LPDETLLHVFSYFSPKELCKVSHVCHNWTQLSRDDTLWSYWTNEHFLLPKSSSAKDTYRTMHTTHKPYISCYARVQKMWIELEQWLGNNQVLALRDLSAGASKKDLEEFASSVKRKSGGAGEVSLELLCSLSMHDGQQKDAATSSSGLFGGYEVYNYRVNIRLLSADWMSGFPTKRNQPPWTYKTIPVAASYMVPCVYYLVIEDFSHGGREFTKGMILHHSHAFATPVLEARSYLEWMEGYVRDLQRGRYDVSRGVIIRFSRLPEDGSDVLSSCGIKVQANALFVPPRSTLDPRDESAYFFAYRIQLSIDETTTAPAMRLVSRYWLITDGDGGTHEVEGDGVIGEYPLLKPGYKFTYCSCCPLRTPDGTMQGVLVLKSK